MEVKGRRAEAHAITITRNEMLAAMNATDSFILAAALVEVGFVHQQPYVPSLVLLFGAEPGFNEVHRGFPWLRSRPRRSNWDDMTPASPASAARNSSKPTAFRTALVRWDADVASREHDCFSLEGSLDFEVTGVTYR